MKNVIPSPGSHAASLFIAASVMWEPQQRREREILYVPAHSLRKSRVLSSECVGSVFYLF